MRMSPIDRLKDYDTGKAGFLLGQLDILSRQEKSALPGQVIQTVGCLVEVAWD
ncbi:hypothetical protein [Laspinema palackyanum]|uniref:hypothetical protein n=1 Tax=Laspinema palackyanum TaxID=3231601 RepID=UPI00345D9500|nr:hypothetical protein [Laspinema sp. D2c]